MGHKIDVDPNWAEANYMRYSPINLNNEKASVPHIFSSLVSFTRKSLFLL